MTVNPHSAIHVFSRATLAAIKLAADPRTPRKLQREATRSAVANARALWRAAERAV